MNVVVASTKVPFISGGAELMTDNLVNNIRKRGHVVDLITAPFKFNSNEDILNNMQFWESQDFNTLDSFSPDIVISLKFPAYYLKHFNQVNWIMHQHRGVYDLWNTPYGGSELSKSDCEIRDKIMKSDRERLLSANRNYTISKNVSKRMEEFNGVESEHLYQPSSLHEFLSPGYKHSYIFCPSRLEDLKRQELLIMALSKSKTNCTVLFSGSGGSRDKLLKLIEDNGLSHRCILLGKTTDQEMVKLYSNALAVFFAPIDEDYGFITLEAMQSGNLVITCNDSGGPLEFITDGRNGFVLEPNPEVIAEKIDYLTNNKVQAKNMGLQAAFDYKSLNLSWDRIIDTLLQDCSESGECV
jgi:glycosyltransferase involved in cell wall biosynthesis